jgi:hypothetical protein
LRAFAQHAHDFKTADLCRHMLSTHRCALPLTACAVTVIELLDLLSCDST